MSFFPTSVLVGVDGTSQSRRALEAAVELALGTGSPVHLLHVRSTSGTLYGRPMTPAQRETADAEASELLDRESAFASELGLEVAGTHLRYGDNLARTIADAAEQLEIGLLVVGESSSGRLAQLLTSPASTTTVRRSHRSVLVVRS